MVINKKGYVRILEAAISVMIVSSVLLVVYNNQGSEEANSGDLIFNLQKKILADISSRSDLRKAALEASPENLTYLENYTASKIPASFNHSIRVCELGNQTDFCKLNETIFVDTVGKNVFAEEIIISSDLGLSGDKGYNPKKVRLYIWDAG